MVRNGQGRTWTMPWIFVHTTEKMPEKPSFFDDEKAMAKSTNIASNINQKIIRAAVEK